jgi:small neutral amino acid transporter SnatA (MarC family)
VTLASAALLLFFVMDPLGNVPLFLAALAPAVYLVWRMSSG